MKTKNSDCADCPVHHTQNLIRLGISTKKFDYIIGLAGNPNTGKSTVFNNLTGLRQHTGNWPGKTIARAEGGYRFNNKQYKLVDLPGTYSLLSTSTEEEIGRNFILFGRPDVTVVVADATRLAHNLNLILQVLEITNRVVLCLNLMDEAKRKQITVDVRALSKELGIPVIPTSARYKKGMNELLLAIEEVTTGTYVCKPKRVKSQPSSIKNAIETVAGMLAEKYPGLPNLNWVALRLLEGDQIITDAIKTGELHQLSSSNA